MTINSESYQVDLGHAQRALTQAEVSVAYVLAVKLGIKSTKDEAIGED